MNASRNVQNFTKFTQILVRINWLAIVAGLTSSDQQPFTLWQSIGAIRQCIRFLALILQYPEACLVPNKEIDAVIHILEQQLWFNRYFDHQPGLGTRGEADCQKWLQAFELTRQLFERHFGLGSMGKVQPAHCETVERQLNSVSKTQPASCEVCLKAVELAV